MTCVVVESTQAKDRGSSRDAPPAVVMRWPHNSHAHRYENSIRSQGKAAVFDDSPSGRVVSPKESKGTRSRAKAAYLEHPKNRSREENASNLMKWPASVPITTQSASSSSSGGSIEAALSSSRSTTTPNEPECAQWACIGGDKNSSRMTSEDPIPQTFGQAGRSHPIATSPYMAL